jgi:phosphoribosylglycinamide formyltransferase-1
MAKKLKLGVLLSGGGTTLLNLLERQKAGKLAGEVVCVASDRPGVLGLERPRQAGFPGLPTRVAEPPKEMTQRAAWGADLLGWCGSHNADVVLMCGFLRLLPLPDGWVGRVLNIHPSLLPAFGGKGFHGEKVHQAALDAGVKLSGCTVHFADQVYDRGPILVQKAVLVRDDDTSITLAARVFEAECEAYPEAIALLAAGRVRLEGGRARITPA